MKCWKCQTIFNDGKCPECFPSFKPAALVWEVQLLPRLDDLEDRVWEKLDKEGVEIYGVRADILADWLTDNGFADDDHHDVLHHAERWLAYQRER